MKKIFYFIASAIVALGAVACQNDINEGVTPEQEGFSINANIGDITRIAITDSDNKEGYKTLSWEGTETLTAYLKGERFEFTNTTEAPNTFTCTTPGVKAKFEEEYATSNFVEFYYNYDLLTYGEYDKHEVKYALVGQYVGGDAINMTAAGCIFHFSCTEDVTLKYYYQYDGTTSGAFLGGMQELTFSAGEYYIGATVRSEETTLEAWIGDEKVKSTTKSFEENKIYNLGTIEKPAPKTYKVYVIAQPKSAQAAWTKVNVYTWDIDPLTAWPGTDITNNKEIINGYTYNYLEYPATWTGKNVNVIINNGSAQTPDIELGKLDKNYYVVYNDAGTVYTEAPAAGSIKEAATTQSSKWALAGDFNSWGEKAMEVVAGETKLFVAKNVNIGAYKEIKVKEKGNWDNSYGGGINYLNQNIWTKVYSGGANFSVVNAGTYDVYFDEANTKLYLMKAGTDYKTAKEQSTNGAAPDLSGASWGLCGAHNNWNSPDIKLEWDGTISLYVAKNAKLTGEFKVRANNSWGEDYGCNGTITVNASAGKAMTRGGGNCKVASGTYDVYFDFAGKKIWVKTPGSAAPTK